MSAVIVAAHTPDEHTLPQAPQLFASEERFASQPSVSLLPLQSPKPVLQAPLQRPPLQAAAMCCGEQASPHPAQLSGSVAVEVSQPSVRLLALQSANPP